ncbi:Zinc metalloproteinase nas-4 [Armadillidium nasatum]|uniref:Metalloendopeptidase n=1 Tax=Armadillidium nasatum TaxID=96803 RepID=A0A5N5SJP5_9CRUS|nr:Zinc metalloproteinase nas-4 [Armadillidium nasatum]
MNIAKGDIPLDNITNKILNRSNSLKVTLKDLPKLPDSHYFSSCWSYVGKIGGRQQVSLPKWCTNVFGSVQHEFLHALGFFHEQARPNRDSYVDIKWENIDEGNKINFEKARSENVYAFGEPYDFESII